MRRIGGKRDGKSDTCSAGHSDWSPGENRRCRQCARDRRLDMQHTPSLRFSQMGQWQALTLTEIKRMRGIDG